QVLEDLVAGGDDARVRLESALGEDHVRELEGEVDVGAFQGSGPDGAEPAGTGLGQARGPGVRGFSPQVLPLALEATRVHESREGNRPDLFLGAVEVGGRDHARAVDGDTDKGIVFVHCDLDRVLIDIQDLVAGGV